MPTSAPSLRQRPFGTLPDGSPVDEYLLDNGRGMTLGVINLGGIVTAIHTLDRYGRSANVVLGFRDLSDYVERSPHFGTIVGRYANRIARGRFTLDGRTHALPLNDGNNTLHGGACGFGARWWRISPVPASEDGSVGVRLERVSPDGEENFPGELKVCVQYTLNQRQEWHVDYRATCDAPTVVNLSHHDYFNLAGEGSALEHELTLAASRYTAVDRELIPVALSNVQDTPFDFREPVAVGARIRQVHAQLALARGYDHSWVLDRGAPGLQFAARLQHRASGRVLEIETTEPAMQFYSGNFLDGSLPGSGGSLYRQGDGVCLEPQHYPDAPNRPDFPSTTLRPGETFSSHTVYRFGVVAD